MRTRRVIATAAALALALTTVIPGCSPASSPVTLSRTTLGTVVKVTVYGEEATARAAAEDAFTAMDEVSSTLDAYTSGTPIGEFNAEPYTSHALPNDALEILDAINMLGVTEGFSATLWSLGRLYGFETTPTVPATEDLALALAAADGFKESAGEAVFARLKHLDPRLAPGGELAPGLDFGGAAKGLGLDRAVVALTVAGAENAVVSAGSGTVTIGSKPDGTPWRVGVEDPREPDTVVAIIEADGPCSVATSGDYQRYFELGGVRYHHILDPATGEPARGLRSLTVFAPYASLSALDADVLSTALFVMGPEVAERYADEHGLGLYMVDAEGRALTVPAPEDCGVRLVIEAEPVR